MTGREISEAIRSGNRVYGTAILSPSPTWLNVVGSMGLDFVFIDTEHTPIDREKLSWMCHAYNLSGLAPIVRIPSPDPYEASMAIDGGAVGVIAPYIETAEQVMQLCGAVKYRPLKGKLLADLLSKKKIAGTELQQYISKTNINNLMFINLESTPAVDAIDELLAVDGLDGVVVGPHDLACSLGIPEKYEHPLFVETMNTIIAKTTAKNLGMGIHTFYQWDLEQSRKWMDKGANLVFHNSDLLAFRNTLAQDIAEFKKP